jgi:hypothetical protein
MKTLRNLWIAEKGLGIGIAGAAIGVLLAAGIALGPLGCSVQTTPEQVSEKIPNSPEELLVELKTQRDQIDEATGRLLARIDQFNSSRPSGDRTIQFSELFTEDLNDVERDILNTMLAEEQDISYKSLLQKIISDRDIIRDLQEKTLRLEQALPDRFVLAKTGDTHHDLATAYLINEVNLDPEKAKSLLARADQTDELLPGNKVWFFYDPRQDSFRTYITQGEAGRTPLVVRRAVKRALISERDAARAEATEFATERDVARAEIRKLEQVKSNLETDVALLRRNKAQLESSVQRLSNDLAFEENTLRYHAAAVSELKELGVLSRVLKRVEDIREIDFDSALDLRRASSITLTPELFGLERITRVRVLPRIYEEGRDFTVETSEENGDAKLVILDTNLFRGKEVLLAVGG